MEGCPHVFARGIVTGLAKTPLPVLEPSGISKGPRRAPVGGAQSTRNATMTGAAKKPLAASCRGRSATKPPVLQCLRRRSETLLTGGTGERMRRAFLAACLSAVALRSTSGLAQRARTALTTISQVAGEWKGLATPGDLAVSIVIDELGVCTIATPASVDRGAARIEGGFLLVRFTSERGQLKLELIDRHLEGVMVVATRTSAIKLTRP